MRLTNTGKETAISTPANYFPFDVGISPQILSDYTEADEEGKWELKDFISREEGKVVEYCCGTSCDILAEIGMALLLIKPGIRRQTLI